MGGLAAALTGSASGTQQPVHARHRVQVGSLIQQDGPRLGKRLVAEPFAVQHAATASAIVERFSVEKMLRPFGKVRSSSTSIFTASRQQLSRCREIGELHAGYFDETRPRGGARQSARIAARSGRSASSQDECCGSLGRQAGNGSVMSTGSAGSPSRRSPERRSPSLGGKTVSAVDDRSSASGLAPFWWTPDSEPQAR